MADPASLHIWKKFLTLQASAWHRAISGGPMVFKRKGRSWCTVYVHICLLTVQVVDSKGCVYGSVYVYRKKCDFEKVG